MRTGAVIAVTGVAWVIAAGCQRKLVATPNLYAQQRVNPFQAVPPPLQGNTVEVLYVTDRQPIQAAGGLTYGHGRDPSVALGTCVVTFGRSVSWPQLVEASRCRQRDADLWLSVSGVKELGRWPEADGLAATAPADDLLRRAVGDRLSVAGGGDVYVFIHGFNTKFEEGPEIIAQLWHFLGRRGVPVAYCWPSWPAERGGLRSYSYDYESCQYTLVHLERLLLLLGSCPGVGRVHLIAHSRGTAVALGALREVHLKLGCDPKATRAALKLGAVILAAPDLDIELMDQRLRDERLLEAPQRVVIYVSRNDPAMGLADWLFAGRRRAGWVRPQDVPPGMVAVLQDADQVQVIDAEVHGYSRSGHDYFYTHPAVSSDLILVLQGRYDPGPANGRPLKRLPGGFWRIIDDYVSRGSGSP